MIQTANSQAGDLGNLIYREQSVTEFVVQHAHGGLFSPSPFFLLKVNPRSFQQLVPSYRYADLASLESRVIEHLKLGLGTLPIHISTSATRG